MDIGFVEIYVEMYEVQELLVFVNQEEGVPKEVEVLDLSELVGKCSKYLEVGIGNGDEIENVRIPGGYQEDVSLQENDSPIILRACGVSRVVQKR